MVKKQMKSALTDSIKAEEKNFQNRFDKADQIFGSGDKDKDEKVPNTSKIDKSKRIQTIRDSFTIPDFDYGKISSLQERLLKLGLNANKSEIVRAGFHALENLSDQDLLLILQSLEKIKTGRPKNK